jgi:predicted TPR repeat methyltransferase/Flp pilus assembly protein TadD
MTATTEHGMDAAVAQYVSQAQRLLDGGRHEEAVVVSSLATMISPESVDARLVQASAFLAAGRTDDAIRSLEEVAATPAADARTFLQLARALDKAGEATEAIGAASEAVIRDQLDPDACSLLGTLLRRLGHVDRALLCHADALRHDSGSAVRYRDLAIDMLANGSPESAVELMDRAAGMPGRGFEDDLVAALARLASGEVDPGIAAVRDLISRTGGDVSAYILLGCGLRASGRHEDAVAAFEMAAVIDPALAPVVRLVSAAMLRDPSLDSARLLDLVFAPAAAVAEDLDLEERVLRIPGLFDRLLSDHLPAGRVADDALDLSCGAGLIGVVLQARARELTGVDPSPDHLRQAAARGVYRTLHAGNPLRYLARTGRVFGLVASAEGLAATADPAVLVEAAAARLAPGGHLLLACETTWNGASQQVRPGAYAHDPQAVRAAADAAGLDCVASLAEILFVADFSNVSGEVMLFRRRHA